jgi:hypothetical protein
MEDEVKNPFFVSWEGLKIVFGSQTSGTGEKGCTLTFWQLHYNHTFDIIDLLANQPGCVAETAGYTEFHHLRGGGPS